MAVSLSVIAAKDSAGTAIAGGLQAQDKSGAGTGPFTLGQILIDGVAGVNMAQVTATNAVKVDGSAVTQPVSIATAPVLVAGTAIIGKVGLDQTTDGTTNKVAADVRFGGVAANLGSGTGGAATQRVIIDSSQFSALGQTTASASAPVVIASDQSAVKTNPVVSATANGGTASRVNAAASTNATNLKASAGQIYTIDVFNPAAYNVFLKLYNKASSPTVGTDTPVMTIPVQAGGGYSKTWTAGLPFATGISYAITKLQADSDTTVVVAGDLTGNMLWI